MTRARTLVFLDVNDDHVAVCAGSIAEAHSVRVGSKVTTKYGEGFIAGCHLGHLWLLFLFYFIFFNVYHS